MIKSNSNVIQVRLSLIVAVLCVNILLTCKPSAVSNTSNPPLIVLNANRTATLDKKGLPSDAFSGTPAEGT